MGVRGIRGATTADTNQADEIWQRSRELVEMMIRDNDIQPDDVASVIFTVSPDLDQAYPATGVRDIPGWDMVPLMCSTEIPVPGGLPRCIRVMMLVNTDKSQDEIRHVFLRDARKLRPDLAEKS
ncbi:MAG: chorismate mutase [Bacillaceae bacterium]|nr:chorismate mutase [Bacillaceae bacterium]